MAQDDRQSAACKHAARYSHAEADPDYTSAEYHHNAADAAKHYAAYTDAEPPHHAEADLCADDKDAPRHHRDAADDPNYTRGADGQSHTAFYTDDPLRHHATDDLYAVYTDAANHHHEAAYP